MRVLIVEDEPIAGEAVARYLELHGHDVRLARHGKAAITEAGGFEPEVLLTDWRLEHDMDGVEVARQLQDQCPGLLTLLVSAYPQASLRKAASGLANTYFLTKPLSLSGLVALLEAA